MDARAIMSRGALSPEDVWQKYDAQEARLSAPVSERMLDLARLEVGMRVLDLATGRGEPALRAARRVAPSGRVLGTDIAAPMLAMARARARDEGITNLDLRVVNAESLEGIPDASFDVATARWGINYMREPLRALASIARVLRPGGLLVAAFWADPARVPWASLPRTVLARYRDVPPIDPEAPGVFRLAEPARIRRDLEASGFSLEHLEEMDVPVIEVERGEQVVEWLVDFGLARLACELAPDQAAAWAEDVAREAEKLRVGERIPFGGVTLLVVARSRPAV